jgi:hypothetical protein
MQTIQQSLDAIEARKSAEALYRQAGELLVPEIAKMTPKARATFWTMMRDLAVKALAVAERQSKSLSLLKPPTTPPPCKTTITKTGSKPKCRVCVPDNSSDVQCALSLADQIESMADEVPERGQEFADSVRGRAAEIAETIEERGSVTENQMAALENMAAGLQRWIDR